MDDEDKTARAVQIIRKVFPEFSFGPQELATLDEKSRQILDVCSRALDVIGDEINVIAWLERENRSLGGRRPVSLLGTDIGCQLVLDTLGQVEFGVVS